MQMEQQSGLFARQKKEYWGSELCDVLWDAVKVAIEQFGEGEYSN